MKIYGVREEVGYEIFDLIEFFAKESDARERCVELNRTNSPYYEDYKVEELKLNE